MAYVPVCGMQVEGSTAVKLKKDGKLCFFCSAHCKERFLQEKS